MNSRPSTFKYQSCEYCTKAFHEWSNKFSTHTLCMATATAINGGEHEPLNNVCDEFNPNTEAKRIIKISKL